MSVALTPDQIDDLTSINVVSALAEYDDCIVVGQKNLSDITEELQKGAIDKVNSAVEAVLSAEAAAIAKIQEDRAALLATTTPSSTSPSS